MWELDYKESWALKNWCFWTVVLEKTLESPLDCKDIKSVNSKGNQSWIFTGRTDAKAEAPILWPPDVKNWLIGKDPDAGKDWRQEEKGTTEDEMVGWYHWLDGHEFEQALGAGDEQESLACCSHGVAKSQTRLSDGTELNWNMKCKFFLHNSNRKYSEGNPKFLKCNKRFYWFCFVFVSINRLVVLVTIRPNFSIWCLYHLLLLLVLAQFLNSLSMVTNS